MAGIGRLDRADRRPAAGLGAGHSLFGIVGEVVVWLLECRACGRAGPDVARAVALGMAQRGTGRRGGGAVTRCPVAERGRGAVARRRRVSDASGWLVNLVNRGPGTGAGAMRRRTALRSGRGRWCPADAARCFAAQAEWQRRSRSSGRRRFAAVRPAAPASVAQAAAAKPAAGEAGWTVSADRSAEGRRRRAPGAGPSEEALQANARLLETVLSDYGVQGEIVEIRPGPGGHAVRTGAGAGHPQRPGDRPGGRRRAQPVGDRGAYRHGARAQRHRHRGAEQQARDGVPQRDPGERGGAEARRAAVAGAGQGYRRQGDRCRPGADAASDDRRHHRFGQVGRRQRDDPVVAVPAVAGPVPADPDRSEDAGTVDL